MTAPAAQRTTGGQLARTALRPPDWHDRADCQDHDERDWYSPDKGRRHRARLICAGCPVQFDCALDALQRGEPHGMWGGLTVADRRTVAAEYGYPIPDAAVHGTRSRYVRGCRCTDCRRAHAGYEHQRRIRAT